MTNVTNLRDLKILLNKKTQKKLSIINDELSSVKDVKGAKAAIALLMADNPNDLLTPGIRDDLIMMFPSDAVLEAGPKIQSNIKSAQRKRAYSGGIVSGEPRYKKEYASGMYNSRSINYGPSGHMPTCKQSLEGVKVQQLVKKS